jgi:hypothetical protein
MKNFEIKYDFDIEKALGIAIAVNSTEPKTDYTCLEIDVLILCFHFNWRLTYQYK